MAETDDAVTDRAEQSIERIGCFVHAVEIFAAAVFAVLFAIGVGDLVLQIVRATMTGAITDPLVVIGFIDTGLLLLIIVEVYQTVIAYVEESNTSRIVVLVTYTGIIAMVRKIITFRTGEYATATDALLAASAYTLVLFGLVALLWVYRSSDGSEIL
ncbi:phosphate-starvation-inducible PsiE family protein [Natribaculum luteum]|uniref:Phosphate-starvation-inducible PsiE family protein n=1 Tax=Natribaculum luteum TaxID=1586232 RepID=A0ABD5P214_9EURY|nr:phosphate-starvation-inducible PsiE family protein [Natribaculum luteum]